MADNPNARDLNIYALEPDDEQSILKDLERLSDSTDINENDVMEWISQQMMNWLMRSCRRSILRQEEEE